MPAYAKSYANFPSRVIDFYSFIRLKIYLFIAHDLSMVKYISDRIGVLHLGHLVETGTTKDIFDRPLHPYTKSLLSAVPHPDPRVEKQRTVIAYDYKSSGIDYTKGSYHAVSETHSVLATDEEFARWSAR